MFCLITGSTICLTRAIRQQATQINTTWSALDLDSTTSYISTKEMRNIIILLLLQCYTLFKNKVLEIPRRDQFLIDFVQWEIKTILSNQNPDWSFFLFPFPLIVYNICMSAPVISPRKVPLSRLDVYLLIQIKMLDTEIQSCCFIFTLFSRI